MAARFPGTTSAFNDEPDRGRRLINVLIFGMIKTSVSVILGKITDKALVSVRRTGRGFCVFGVHKRHPEGDLREEIGPQQGTGEPTLRDLLHALRHGRRDF